MVEKQRQRSPNWEQQNVKPTEKNNNNVNKNRNEEGKKNLENEITLTSENQESDQIND